MRPPRSRTRAYRNAALALVAVVLLAGADETRKPSARAVTTAPAAARDDAALPGAPARNPAGGTDTLREQLLRTAPTVLIFAIASLAPAAVLMVTAFVRISVVLTLLRQALGSPQIPGNQVLTALALLLTILVMKPAADAVYTRGIEPFASGHLDAATAWEAGTAPIKQFMLDQIRKTHHEDYLWTLYDYSERHTAGQPDPTEYEQFPLRVVAPAFLLSELTTALVMGFAIYLPFLVIDLVVSSVLAAMGLFMLPPSLVSIPLKLILFVLADGWMLVAGMLLRSFGSA